MAAVEVENLTKRFGDFCAVDHLNFAVENGEIFGLLGPNGAGKSTLIRMLTTLVPPSEGTARINGYDIVKNANEVRQSIGVIPQAMTSDLDLTRDGEHEHFRQALRHPAGETAGDDRGAAEGGGSGTVDGQTCQDVFRGDEAAAGDRARAGA